MVIILKYIPAKTTKLDLKNFVSPAVRGGLFSRGGTIKSVSILVNRDKRTQAHEYHGLVEVEPEAVAHRLLKNFKRKSLHGKFIAISEYHERNWHNDPRLFNRFDSEKHIEKRVGDRRNKFKEAVESQKFVSNKDFHRKLG